MLLKRSAVFVFFLFVVLIFSACYYDKADLVYPPAGPCDTANVSYATTLVPILTRSCYSCHSGTAAAGAGIKLDSYASVVAQVTKGRLIGSISHQSGFSAMPQGAPKLLDCEMLKFKAWVTAGNPNN